MNERDLVKVAIKILGLFLIFTGLLSILNDLVCVAGFFCLGNKQGVPACSFYIGSFFSAAIRMLGGLLLIKKDTFFVNLLAGNDEQ